MTQHVSEALLERLHVNPELATARAGLVELGYIEFATIDKLQTAKKNGDNKGCRDIPKGTGVYAVVKPTAFAPRFLDKAGRPVLACAYPVHDLKDRWVDGVDVLNFGKAESRSSDLRIRIRQYVLFGLGKVENHVGGRAIWQLDGAGDLEIGYLETRDLGIPAEFLECAFATAFWRATGQAPFAWRRPLGVGS